MTSQHASTRAALAMLLARLASLPEGEHIVIVDMRSPGRPRWRIADAGKWEAPRREEPEPTQDQTHRERRAEP